MVTVLLGKINDETMNDKRVEDKEDKFVRVVGV